MRHVAIEPRPWRAPAEVLSAFGTEAGTCAFLSGGQGARARWSYVLRAPDAALRIGRTDRRDAFGELVALLAEPGEAHPDGPPFQGGVAGLAGYELGDRVEPLALAEHADGWPDLAAYRYPALLAFDHHQERVLAIGRGDSAGAARDRALAAADWLSAPGLPASRDRLADGFAAETAGSAYEAAVAEVVGRIHAGEIFQANIARVWGG
ncbi:MAG: aminodeoxychorismate synthase component I, partial [Caulobacteraceae bacterium]